MPIYNCKCCNYSTKIKSHFSRHLLTKKHINNMEKTKKQKKEKNELTNIKKRTCIHCGKIMSTPYSLKRHIEKGCKKIKFCKNQNTSLNENNIDEFMMNNDFIKNSAVDTNGDTITTNITINGVLININELNKPYLKYTLINAFSHPFFKENMNYIPKIFLEDSEFMYYFKLNHNLNTNTNNEEENILCNLEENIIIDESQNII